MTGLGADRFVLGGFSQGAMVTTDLVLRTDDPPAAACLLSGTLLSEDDWREAAPARAGLPVLQSHGRGDPLLAFPEAEALRDLLAAGGLEVTFEAFDGQHEIPIQVLDAVGALIERVLGAGGRGEGVNPSYAKRGVGEHAKPVGEGFTPSPPPLGPTTTGRGAGRGRGPAAGSRSGPWGS